MSNLDKNIEIVKEVINRLSEIQKKHSLNGFFLDEAKKEKEEIQAIENVLNILDTYKIHCNRHINFCNKIRKENRKEPDHFNQGREDMAIQFLNLLNGKKDWEITED